MRLISNFCGMLLVVPMVFCCITIVSESVGAQEIDFGKIDKFESLGTGTLHVGSPPKTIVDDDERHTVVLTIWEADAETKVYWKSLEGNDRTTLIPGRGVQTFQTAGGFRLEALGDAYHSVEYGYLLLRLKDH
jgi:hypothetical protein